MKQVQADIWETAVESPFPGLTTHAYLLTRSDGNVLFYNTGLRGEIDKIAELGGLAYQYLSHEDELGETLNVIAGRFGSKLCGHKAEQEAFARVRAPDVVFDKREVHLGNIEVIPTPGHSPGSTCFLVVSPQGKQYLFTGDTLYVSQDNRWAAGFIKGVHTESARDVLADSLRVLRELKPDVVFGSAFAGDSGFMDVADGNWADEVDYALEKLFRGR